MNTFLLALLGLLFSAVPTLLAEPAAIPPPAALDPLAEALPILQARYPDFPGLNYRPGDKLADLVARSGGKIAIAGPDAISPLAATLVTLPGNVLYWRLASFLPKKNWKDTSARLQQMVPAVAGVILDLRSNLAPDDYADAAQILGFFAASDATLGPHPESLPAPTSVSAPLVVLTNNQTTGAAEALAACLQADGALVVGRPTAGKVGRFEEQKLSSGQVLRYFVAAASSPPSTPAAHQPLVWGRPVVPDIDLLVDDRSEKAALTLIRDDRVSEVIGEAPERHRMSEAALVQGQDPEWDDYLAFLERKPALLSLPVIHDSVLIVALDSLKAIRLSERSQIPAPASAPASPSSALR